MVALELAHWAEKCEGYRESLRDSNKFLKKLELEHAALAKRVSDLSSELSLLQSQKMQTE